MSPIWQKVYQGTGAPVGAVLASAALSILIALPLLVSEVAFNGCISIAVLGEPLLSSLAISCTGASKSVMFQGR